MPEGKTVGKEPAEAVLTNLLGQQFRYGQVWSGQSLNVHKRSSSRQQILSEGFFFLFFFPPPPNVLLFLELEQAPPSSELGSRVAPNWVGYAQGFILLDLEAANTKILRDKFPNLSCSNSKAFVTWGLDILVMFLEKQVGLLAGAFIQCHHQYLLIANKLLYLRIVLKA